MHIFRSFSLSLLSIYVFCISLLGCSKTLENNVQPLPPKPYSFERYEILTGSTKHQTILTGFLLNGETADIAVVNIDEDNARHLSIYSFNKENWELSIKTTLHSEVLFVDIANIDGYDRLITYEHGQLNWFDPETEVLHKLIDITIHFNPLNVKELPYVNISQDLNDDARDDFVLPDIDGFWISTQLDNGMFTQPIKLGPPDPFLDATALDEKQIYRDVGINSFTVLWYMSRFHLVDYDGDNRNDIVLWNEDHFDVYRQNPQGTFSAVPTTFTVDIPFANDGAYTLAFGYDGESTFALISGFRRKTKRSVLHLLHDLNGDGVTDMVILTLEGRSLGNLKSLYDIYFGKMENTELKFSSKNRLSIRPKGKAGGLLPWGYAYQWWEDIDGDGDVDILYKDVKTTLGGMIRAMAGKSIAIDLECYQMHEGNNLRKPTYRRKIRPVLEIFETERVFFPAVLFGDLNGDNRYDITIGKSWNEMHIYLGMPGPMLYEEQPQKVAVSMPNDERNMRLVDMNNDKKQDILIYHPDVAESHRVKMLISK